MAAKKAPETPFVLWAKRQLQHDDENEKEKFSLEPARIRILSFHFRSFKDPLIFSSEESYEKFKKARRPFKKFDPHGDGLPLFSISTIHRNRSTECHLGEPLYVICRYATLEEGTYPKGLYEMKSTHNGYTLFKIVFCVVTKRKTLSEPSKEEYELAIDDKGTEIKYKIFRTGSNRDLYVVKDTQIRSKWSYTPTGIKEYRTSVFTIRNLLVPPGLKRDEDVAHSAISQDWDASPVVGYCTRAHGTEFLDQLKKPTGTHLLLGESGPPDYDSFTVSFETQLNACISLVVNALEEKCAHDTKR